MIYKEEVRDLFSVPEDYYLAHCISADFGMAKGIAVEFNKHFNMKNILQHKYPDYLKYWNRQQYTSDCILEGRVFNLITKERCFHKPTYDSLYRALKLMKLKAEQEGIDKIAIPLIGCGLDKLEWYNVSNIIQEVFKDTDVEMLVCKIK